MSRVKQQAEVSDFFQLCCPEYRPVNARQIKLDNQMNIWVKDESGRLGLGSFTRLSGT